MVFPVKVSVAEGLDSYAYGPGSTCLRVSFRGRGKVRVYGCVVRIGLTNLEGVAKLPNERLEDADLQLYPAIMRFCNTRLCQMVKSFIRGPRGWRRPGAPSPRRGG